MPDRTRESGPGWNEEDARRGPKDEDVVGKASEEEEEEWEDAEDLEEDEEE